VKVSCVMLTANRRRFVPAAIACFLQQTHEERELVIYDSGDVPIQDLIPRDPRIRYYRRPSGFAERTVGEYRNIANDLASGDLIAHWDDDDYSAPTRLATQLGGLNFAVGPIVGFSSMLFFDTRDRSLWFYRSERHHYALGTSLLYPRSFWLANRFPAKDHGEDNALIAAAGAIISFPAFAAADAFEEPELSADPLMIARIHTSNVWQTGLNDRVRKNLAART
jgi:glycosyltransferase involved in cell wall biosynthesis